MLIPMVAALDDLLLLSRFLKIMNTNSLLGEMKVFLVVFYTNNVSHYHVLKFIFVIGDNLIDGSMISKGY